LYVRRWNKNKGNIKLRQSDIRYQQR
jgi:hypothetical protein